jgi:Leucine-rich repeat (LRR) protein
LHLSQKLDLSRNKLSSLPVELSSLVNLSELLLTGNQLPEPPVAILRHLTALKTIELHHNRSWAGTEDEFLRTPSSLLPILHPGLVKLDLQQ